MNASEICKQAESLVKGDRAKTHGNKLVNHTNIAALWNAYLGDRLEDWTKITPLDVTLMMALLKIARTQLGQHNIDNYVDLAGYAGCAGEIADATK